MLFVRKGREGVGHWMECSAMLGPLFPLTFFVSPDQCMDRERSPQSWCLERPLGKTSASERHFLRTFPHLGDNKPRTTVREETARGETLWCGRSYVFADR